MDAARCIDGRPDTTCATTNEANAWLSVRLPPLVHVDRVQVFNTVLTCCMRRLATFEVWVGRAYGDVSPPSAYRCGGVTRSAGAYLWSRRVATVSGPLLAPS